MQPLYRAVRIASIGLSTILLVEYGLLLTVAWFS